MRLIDADELRKRLDEGVWNDAVAEVDAMPTIEAVPVVYGFNDNRNYHEADEFRCSECGIHLEDWVKHIYDEDTDDEYFQGYVFKYCPNCGAKMGGAE